MQRNHVFFEEFEYVFTLLLVYVAETDNSMVTLLLVFYFTKWKFFVICYEFCKLQTHIFIDSYSAIDVNRPCYVDVDEDVLPQS